jgi:hypothetical protein
MKQWALGIVCLGAASCNLGASIGERSADVLDQPHTSTLSALATIPAMEESGQEETDLGEESDLGYDEGPLAPTDAVTTAGNDASECHVTNSYARMAGKPQGGKPTYDYACCATDCTMGCVSAWWVPSRCNASTVRSTKPVCGSYKDGKQVGVPCRQPKKCISKNNPVNCTVYN